MGIMLGMAGVSMFIFLDHKDVIHLQSAHNYRNAAFAMVQDPETRTLIEESSGLIFMGLKSHETQINEIAAFPGKIKVREEKIIMLGGDMEVAKKEHAAIKPGYNILVKDPALGLDKFCGECSWNWGTNCDTRLTYLNSADISQIDRGSGRKNVIFSNRPYDQSKYSDPLIYVPI